MPHTVATTHIQALIRNSLTLAEAVDGLRSIDRLDGLPDSMFNDERLTYIYPDQALEKAVADLRHAAEELEAERLSCHGWRQQ